jgi:cyclopropane-fatty-acyl-phospholipid synthase
MHRSNECSVDQPRRSLTKGSVRTLRRHRGDVASTARDTLQRLADGRLAHLPVTVRFWDGSVLEGEQAADRRSSEPHPAPVVVARNRRALSHLVHEPGELGLARAWVDGSLIASSDLEDVLATRRTFPSVSLSLRDRLRLMLAAVRAAGLAGVRRPPVPAVEASVTGRRHSLSRDRTAIRHHYDISNDFYALVLGPSMVYSCGYFSTERDGLEEAQQRKLDLICRKLRLAPGERFLDIGCGWGSLVLHAAANYGVEALGVTLSEAQAQLARARIREQGLSDRVEVRVADYRELGDPQFDKIASVGMYEHVGRSELDVYTESVSRLLRPGGLFLNHGIARLASRPPTSDTFISRYVFPDGELHPVGDLVSSMQTAGFEVRDVENLREHYPLTLRRWASNLRNRSAEAERLVGPERVRVWLLYMLASATAFDDGDIAVYQVLAARHDGPHGLPLTRAELLRPVLTDTHAAPKRLAQSPERTRSRR